MREIARPEVKRRRRFKRAVVAPAAAVPEPSVADKYYAQKKTCRMVELGIKVPGCKGTFVPRGSEVACSPACRDRLDRYHNAKSEKKNRPKHRAARNAGDRARYARRKGTPPGRPCQGPDCPEIYYSWKPEKKFCSKRCKLNHENEVKRKRRRSRGIKEAPKRLSDYQRNEAIKRHAAGEKVAEIAKELDVRTATIAMTIWRARKKRPVISTTR
jgi:DNA-directed RNA polymerase specialized sigma24 family protein